MNEVTLALIGALAGGAGVFGAVQAITLVSARARSNAAIGSLIAAREASASIVVKRTVQHAIDRQALVLSSIYLFPLRPRIGMVIVILLAGVIGLALPAVVHFTGILPSVEPTGILGFSLFFGALSSAITTILWFLAVSLFRIEFLTERIKKLDHMNYIPPDYPGMTTAKTN